MDPPLASPAPAPEPLPETSEVIITAEHIHTEHYYKVRSRENICKIKITNEEGNIYYIELTPDTDFWKEHDKYFQGNFTKFSKIMDDTLVLETGDIAFKIIKEDFEEIILQFIYNGLFGFEILLSIPRKKDRIDLLDNEIQDLTKSNEDKDKTIIDLETRLKYVEDIIQMNIELRKYHNGPFLDFPDKGYSKQWPPLRYTIIGTGVGHGNPAKFDYCQGFSEQLSTDNREISNLRTNDRIFSHMETFNEYIKIYKDPDFNSKLQQGCNTNLKSIYSTIPWASFRRGHDETSYKFTDLPKWLEFLDKWKDKEPGHFEKDNI